MYYFNRNTRTYCRFTGGKDYEVRIELMKDETLTHLEFNLNYN